MIELFTGRDEKRYPHIFKQMYEQRFDIYVTRRRWKGLKPKDGLEKDQFDTEQAIYLLAMDDRDTILAGLRLLPTTGPHIFGDLFPQLAGAGAVPRGKHILELTRFYVAPFGAGRDLRKWLIGIISAGMFEYGLEHGITQISSVIDTFLLPQMLELEWRVRPLGLPFRYGEGSAVGVLIDVCEEALQSTRRIKGLTGPVLHTPSRPVPRIPASLVLAHPTPAATPRYAH